MSTQQPSFYARAIAPRLVSFLCGFGAITEQRRRVVPRATGRVLEIGIGSGHNLPYYDSEKVSAVIGVDPDPTMLGLGRGRFDLSRVPLQVEQGTAEALQIDDRSIDTALITYTLCSLPDPDLALAEIRRVLRPEGRIVFCEHGRAETERVARWQDRINALWRCMAGGCNLNRDVGKQLTASGFDVVEMERFALPGFPKIIGSHYVGSATPR
jgi:ubiquinone/menaquinone biosynthesis C-methylase UbiE